MTLQGFAVVTAFAVVAFLARGVSRAGAVAGWVLTLMIYAAMGWRGFLLVTLVFAETMFATRIAEGRRRTPRSANQVTANLAVAAVAAFLWPSSSVAALAELAADTCASELGRRFGHGTWLFPTFERVQAGTEGGISVVGTLMGMFAAALVATCAFVLHLSLGTIFMVWIAAMAGMFVDSLAGALLETRGLLNNNAVNVLGTLTAAVTGYLLQP